MIPVMTIDDISSAKELIENLSSSHSGKYTIKMSSNTYDNIKGNLPFTALPFVQIDNLKDGYIKIILN